ncbi:hypothetical protein N7492_003544 [Penicillium capsulatum]|uniref:Uncharacterized protein n=1 Tax=Penicillium capsulatum TaxID=69766 RepID=A0A9W9IM30_9EURO|nr:hypothetical protein N7492_003544 [Penicillium capsulatum]
MGPNSVRRNLFQQNITRRQASGGPSNGMQSGNGGLSTRPSHRLKPTASDSSSSSRSIRLADNRDIVVRDHNGGYKMDVPTLPRNFLLRDDREDVDELEAEDSGEMRFESSELVEREKQKFEAALVDMMIRHRNRQTTGEPDEILDIVHQSLRKKVNALDDDNWMFEPERGPRF